MLASSAPVGASRRPSDWAAGEPLSPMPPASKPASIPPRPRAHPSQQLSPASSLSPLVASSPTANDGSARARGRSFSGARASPSPVRQQGFAGHGCCAHQAGSSGAPRSPSLLTRALSGLDAADTSIQKLRGCALDAVEAHVAEAAAAAAERIAAPETHRPLLDAARADYGDVFDSPLVRRAFAVAAEAHAGQTRRNGDPVVSHVVATAALLAGLGMDERVVAAGLLHDALDDSAMSLPRLRSALSEFGDAGEDVASMVAAVSRVSTTSQLLRDSALPLSALDVERTRSMLLAMADVRVVLIKLCDRLHNMRTLTALPPAKQQRIAQETLDVFAPLANRLGMWGLKAGLEDTAFSILEPEAHARLAARVADVELVSLVSAVDAARAALELAGVAISGLSGRPKSLFSIHRKMKTKGRPVEEIYDVRGIRIIVDTEADCYAALRAIHVLWPPLKDKTKDYIAAPKANGYRSLHTVVVPAGDAAPIEVQIRTAGMHTEAEYGIASHWIYKERPGGGGLSSTLADRQVAWARLTLSFVREVGHPGSSCAFPDHASACPFVTGGACTSPDCDPCAAAMSGPQLIIFTAADGVASVVELPRGTTGAAYLAYRAPNAADRAQLRLLVNDSLEASASASKPLQMGDHVRVLSLHKKAELDHDTLGIGAMGLLASSLHGMNPTQLGRERARLAVLYNLGESPAVSS